MKANREKKSALAGWMMAAFLIGGCSGILDTEKPENPYRSEEVTPDVFVLARPVKIEQLVGDYDREREAPTANQTGARYRLLATDLGVPFRHRDKTYVLFGDSHGADRRDNDVIGVTTDSNPEDGIALDFLADAQGNYRPILIPGISQDAYEVPVEGVSVDGRMYVYHSTDHTSQVTMGRTVVAVSDDDGMTFAYLYDFSRRYFINVSVSECDLSDWPVIEGTNRKVLLIFGSGEYRKSDVYLAYQFSSEIDSPGSVRYFTGLDAADRPMWSNDEEEAVALFDHPCVGELSVVYNPFLRKWIMLYNGQDPRGILLRTADFPWGPWTRPQVLFDPWNDGGYGHFMHISWTSAKRDSVHDPGRENEWGGEYGPYQFEELATGSGNTTTIYFTMSTWNPYTVVLMKATLEKSR